LLEARGGLADEEGADVSEQARRRALEGLHRLLGDRDYREDRMP
jgi:hypothetical protein